MKKTIILLLGLIAIFTVFSCVQELTPETDMVYTDDTQVFTVSFSPETRTAMVDGKTVWTEGDSLWVSNGVASESIVVPAEYYGRQEFNFVPKVATLSDTTRTLYVVYPYTAASSVLDNQALINIPSVQDGRFSNAHIAVGISEKYTVILKNVISLLKITVPNNTEAPITTLSMSSANDNPMTGLYSVDLSGDMPVLIPQEAACTTASVLTSGESGDYYVAVAPGTFDAGFTLCALASDFTHAYHAKQTSTANVARVNHIVSLGTIGSDLQPVPGAGTADNPWLLENTNHVLAFANAVNNGKSFEGEYVKLGNDISGIIAPIGSQTVKFSSSVYTVAGAPFKGHFDGAGHTMTVNITAATAGRSQWVGLFGGLSDGAVVENLIIDGKVNMGGCNNIGGLAGSVYSDEAGVTIRNVTNKAEVRGNNTIGGLVGQASANNANLLVFENCHNEGDVLAGSYGVGGIVGRAINKAVNKVFNGCTNSGEIKGQYNIGGIAGFSYYSVFTDCENSGTVTSTASVGTLTSISNSRFSVPTSAGAGGIGGYFQISSITGSTNTGTISGPNKLGGILAASYWTNLTNCVNKGPVTGTDVCVGGITGWSPAQGNHRGCTNYGAVTGKSYVGGIQGYADMGSSSTSAGQKFYSCVNEGDVKATTEGGGGIVGCTRPYSSSAYVQINECANKGNISVAYRAGGIVGSADVYSNSAFTLIRNCQNDGVVASVRTDADDGCFLGGIVGWCVKVSTGTEAGIRVYNCLNTGKVQYAVSTFKNVYCGGIVGWMKSGKLSNVCNVGAISSVEGVQAEGVNTRLGSIVGQLDNVATEPQRSFISEAYSLAGLADNFAGMTGIDPAIFAEKCPNVRSFDTDGILQEPASINDSSTSSVVVALNLWVNSNTDYSYYSWAWTYRPQFYFGD